MCVPNDASNGLAWPPINQYSLEREKCKRGGGTLLQENVITNMVPDATSASMVTVVAVLVVADFSIALALPNAEKLGVSL